MIERSLSQPPPSGVYIFENRVPIPRDFPKLMDFRNPDKEVILARMNALGVRISRVVTRH